jgi:hypothetical protein
VAPNPSQQNDAELSWFRGVTNTISGRFTRGHALAKDKKGLSGAERPASAAHDRLARSTTEKSSPGSTENNHIGEIETEAIGYAHSSHEAEGQWGKDGWIIENDNNGSEAEKSEDSNEDIRPQPPKLYSAFDY